MDDARMTGGAPAGKGTRKPRGRGAVRRERAADNRTSRERVLTEQERLEFYQSQFHQSILPDIPAIPGYHVCWLSTQNQRDSVQRREMMGYTPVRPEEVPGYHVQSVKTGELAGLIAINEMVAYKLPVSLYQKYMEESHHNAPAREEQKLRDTAEQIREHAASINREAAKVGLGSGTAKIGKNTPQPSFHELTE